MMLGEWLYRITDKDAISAPVIQRRLFFQSFALAAASFTLSPDTPNVGIPDNLVVWISHMAFSATAGAAQTCSQIRVEIIDTNNTVLSLLGRTTGTAALERELIIAPVDLLLFPTERIQATFVFNAGAAINTGVYSVHGLYFPRGNLQRR